MGGEAIFTPTPGPLLSMNRCALMDHLLCASAVLGALRPQQDSFPPGSVIQGRTETTFDPRVSTEGEGGWRTPSPLIH